MVEFALVVSLFIMLVFGALQFGRGFGTKISVQNAARDAVRVAALKGANPALAYPAIPAGMTRTINRQCPAGDTTGNASVTTRQAVSYLVPFWRSGSWTISTTETMRCGG
jgi:Flp pilus assembly protein TadG